MTTKKITTNRKGSNIYPLSKTTIERRENIARIIKSIGLSSLNYSALAREYKVADTTIRKDVARIVEQWPVRAQREYSIDLTNAMEQALSVARRDLMSDEPIVRLNAARVVSGLAKDYVELLERFGLKDRIVQLPVGGTSDRSPTQDIVARVVGEIRLLEVSDGEKEAL